MEGPNDRNDKETLYRLQQGDDRVWEETYRSYWRLIHQLVHKNAGGEEDAKDIYQEAFSAFYENINKPDFELTSKIGTYLYGIAKRLWLKQLRQRGKIGHLVDVDDWGELQLAEEIDFMDESVNERMEIVTQVLSGLGERCAELLKRFYFAKQSMKEIAKAMGYKSHHSTKKQKYKCLGNLRDKVRAQMGLNH